MHKERFSWYSATYFTEPNSYLVLHINRVWILIVKLSMLMSYDFSMGQTGGGYNRVLKLINCKILQIIEKLRAMFT